MPTFTPPIGGRLPNDYIGENDRYYPVSEPLRRLMRHFQAPQYAVNVWKLLDGTYTTTQPYEATPGTVIATVYLGSHTYQISEAEAAALENAGYVVNTPGYGEGAYGRGNYGG